MTSFIKVPFASSGDKAAMPDTDAGGGVNMTQGYGQAYSLDPATYPSAKRIERDKMNWLFNRITQAINEIQSTGVAPFITSADNGGSAFSYGKGALVSLGGVVYQSLVASNTSTPPGANWAALPEKIQPLDATLTALAGLVGAANKLPYFNGDDTAALTDITQVGRDIIGKSTITDIRTYLNLSSFISSPSTGPGDFTQVNSPDGKRYLFIANNNQWGAQTEDGKAIPLTVERGGSGSGTPEGARAAFGLGDSATKNVGTTAGTVAAGDDSRLVNLKSAANRSVGNSANQIPDMSYFTTGETSAGRWAKLPSGLIIQAGFGLTGSAGTATVNLPIPFTGTFYVVGGSIEGNGPIFVSARGLTQSTIGVVAWGRDGSIQVTNMHWLAIGV
ncbi:gp53-like domain-containing protein [Citrobacter freundii]